MAIETDKTIEQNRELRTDPHIYRCLTFDRSHISNRWGKIFR